MSPKTRLQKRPADPPNARPDRWTAAQRRLAALTAIIAGIGLFAILIVARGRHARTAAGRAGGGDHQATAPGRSDFPYAYEPSATPRLVPETPEQIENEVTALVGTWRSSILQRDADAVMKLDGIFRAEPARYASALAKSAKADPDAHVRAFSTRMLGKFVRPDLAGVFTELLSDRSPYVRQNAAWALGELGRAANAHLTDTPAIAALRRARSRDPDSNVRSAARGALDQLE